MQYFLEQRIGYSDAANEGWQHPIMYESHKLEEVAERNCMAQSLPTGWRSASTAALLD